jgi:hypothetical protein
MQNYSRILEEDQYCGSKSKFAMSFFRKKKNTIYQILFLKVKTSRYTEFINYYVSTFWRQSRSLEYNVSLVGDGWG